MLQTQAKQAQSSKAALNGSTIPDSENLTDRIVLSPPASESQSKQIQHSPIADQRQRAFLEVWEHDVVKLKRLLERLSQGLTPPFPSRPQSAPSLSQVIDPYCLPDQSPGPNYQMLVLQHVEENSTCLWDALHEAMIDAGILQASDEDPAIMKQCMGHMKETRDEESKCGVVSKFKAEFASLTFKMKSGSEPLVIDVDSFYQVFVFVTMCSVAS